jgi:hypothetical protein
MVDPMALGRVTVWESKKSPGLFNKASSVKSHAGFPLLFSGNLCFQLLHTFEQGTLQL